jgi:hypothetical protein
MAIVAASRILLLGMARIFVVGARHSRLAKAPQVYPFVD